MRNMDERIIGTEQRMDKAWHEMSPDEALQSLKTGAGGLSLKEAAERQTAYGRNILQEGRKKTLFGIIISQFKNLMILVLAGAAAVSVALGEISDAVIIFAVIALNAVMGTVQEARAEAALEALKKMAAPETRVLRDGSAKVIKAEDLVPGDVVLLEAGDYVPADLRLLQSACLKIEEAALTGESVPSEKDEKAVLSDETPLGERINMAFSGTSVTYGRGTGVVCLTGMRTQIGKIAHILSTTKERQTPLQRRMGALSKMLSYAVLAVAAVVFVTGLLTGREAFEMFFVAVSLAVAAIPEGLATVVTLQLTMGVQKMSRSGAIVRNLPAVETLGSTSVICSDKTGTLTQNSMSVQKVFAGDREYDAQNVPANETVELLDRVFVLCNDTKTQKDGGKLIGDPTETALYAFSSRRARAEKLDKSLPRVFEIPFDSARKLMSTVNGAVSPVLFVKGAPDELIARCTYIHLGAVRKLEEADRERLLEANAQFARQALRVIAAAYKPLSAVPQTQEGLENDLVFLGLAGMMDPPRKEAKEAVEICKTAGIMPVMITGDHKITAVAIAERLGILGADDTAVTGTELDAMDDTALGQTLDRIRVYARVAPEHKVRIVSAFRSRGHVVAMTGDGVNDAPALKSADIGVGMGLTGTEVSKNASDMVLTDDNFATIVSAVREGRRIFRNIKKAVQFLLSANLSEVITLFIGTLMGYTILYPVQILWVNLVTDTFPALALGMEKAPPDIMQRKPRDAKQGFFAKGMAASLAVFGTVMGALTLGVFFLSLGLYNDQQTATTMAFLTLGLIQLFHAYNVRSSSRSVLFGLIGSKWMHMAFALSALLQTAVVWFVPLGTFFRVVPLSGEQWLFSTAAAFAIVPISEAIKAFLRLRKRSVRQDFTPKRRQA